MGATVCPLTPYCRPKEGHVRHIISRSTRSNSSRRNRKARERTHLHTTSKHIHSAEWPTASRNELFMRQRLGVVITRSLIGGDATGAQVEHANRPSLLPPPKTMNEQLSQQHASSVDFHTDYFRRIYASARRRRRASITNRFIS